MYFICYMTRLAHKVSEVMSYASSLLNDHSVFSELWEKYDLMIVSQSFYKL